MYWILVRGMSRLKGWLLPAVGAIAVGTSIGCACGSTEEFSGEVTEVVGEDTGDTGLSSSECEAICEAKAELRTVDVCRVVDEQVISEDGDTGVVTAILVHCEGSRTVICE